MYKYFLNRIDYLSTREESGVKIIKDIIGREAKLVCDPTILLTKEEWQEENQEEDEYEAHGFRDEADYLNWKYG